MGEQEQARPVKDPRRSGLAQYLVEAGLISATDVEENKQRQVVFGGSLDTCLLEAGLLGETQLQDALAAAYGMASVGKAEIDTIDSQIPRLFPLLFAETYHLVPFRQSGNSLQVLVSGEPDQDLLQRVSERLHMPVEPVLALEIRLHYAMNALYGTELLPRFNTLLSRLDGNMVVREVGSAESARPLSWGVRPPPTREWHGGKGLRKVRIRELVAKLEFATDRDTIVDTLLSVVGNLFEFSALFMVQGARLTGWRAPENEQSRKATGVEIDLRNASAFYTVNDTGAHYLGPLEENTTHDGFLGTVGRPYPRAALIAPIRVAHRNAIILYADNGSKGVSPRKVQATLILVQRAALAFTRIIHKRKSTTTRVQKTPDLPLHFQVVPEALPKESRTSVLDFVDAEHVIPITHTGELEVGEADFEAEDPSFSGDDVLDLTFGEIDPSPEAATAAFRAGMAAHLFAADGMVDMEADYVAFADIEEAEALDDWEDVLVSSGETTDYTAVRAPPQTTDAVLQSPERQSVSWQDVVAEAHKAEKLKPVRDETLVVAGREVQHSELLLDGLSAKDAQSRTDAVSRALSEGNSLDEALRQRFPGPIDFDPFALNARIPPFPMCSGITHLLHQRGEPALPVVLPQLENEDPARRFFAVYFLLAVRCSGVVRLLAKRLFDAEPRIRYLAADALRTYSRDPVYAEVVAGIREQLKVPVLETQVSSIQLLGQLRDAGSVPLLIPLVGSPYPQLVQAAVSSLAVICACEHKEGVSRWTRWWQDNYRRARPAWLIDGLSSEAVMMRKVANYELQLLTGMTTHFDAEGPLEGRERSITMWSNWWAKVSHEAHGPPKEAIPHEASSPSGVDSGDTNAQESALMV